MAKRQSKQFVHVLMAQADHQRSISIVFWDQDNNLCPLSFVDNIDDCQLGIQHNILCIYCTEIVDKHSRRHYWMLWKNQMICEGGHPPFRVCFVAFCNDHCPIWCCSGIDSFHRLPKITNWSKNVTLLIFSFLQLYFSWVILMCELKFLPHYKHLHGHYNRMAYSFFLGQVFYGNFHLNTWNTKKWIHISSG